MNNKLVIVACVVTVLLFLAIGINAWMIHSTNQELHQIEQRLGK